MIARGEVWLARLGPGARGEVACVVVSPAELHDHLGIALVAPLSTGHRPAGYRVDVNFEGRPGRILLEQVTAIDQTQLLRSLGSVSHKTLAASLAVLREMFAE